jgi:transposase
MKKEHLKLSETDQSYLTTIISKGQQKARTFRRASALLQLNEGSTLSVVAQNLKMTSLTVANLRDNYLQNGLACLLDKPRSGRPIEFDGNLRAKVTALACSAAPEGRAKWSLNLLADKVVELEYCEKISRSTINQILKKTN